MLTPSALGARFSSKVEVLANGCWYWTAAKQRSGHGFFWSGVVIGWSSAPRLMGPHRWAWQMVNQTELDSKIHLDHFRFPQDGCIGPSCVHPEHVRPASARENTLRGDTIQAKNLAKTHCVHGHEFTPENTYFTNRGGRQCKECLRISKGYQGGLPMGERTHCPQGHAYDDENTIWRADGTGRECRACKREAIKHYEYTGVYASDFCCRGHDQRVWGKIRPNKSRYCILCNRIMAAARAARKKAKQQQAA